MRAYLSDDTNTILVSATFLRNLNGLNTCATFRNATCRLQQDAT